MPRSWVDAAVALSVAAGCLGLYLATMTPGLAYSGGDGIWKVTPAEHLADRREHVETYWRLGASRQVVVATQIGDLTLESHMLGLGNLARYEEEIGIAPDAVVVEAFDLVLPSALPRGTHPLRAGVVSTSTAGFDVTWADLGTVTVE
jgi:hypothetical protein